jgi:hypothetical protein
MSLVNGDLIIRIRITKKFYLTTKGLNKTYKEVISRCDLASFYVLWSDLLSFYNKNSTIVFFIYNLKG